MADSNYFYLRYSLEHFWSYFLLLLTSLISYSADDPGIGRLNGTGEVKNILGFWGALSSSIIISMLGELSYILIVFVLYAGIVTIVGIGSVGLVLKGPL